MNRAFFRIVLAVLASTWSSLSVKAAEDNIQWLVFDFPPIYIVSGPTAGSGFVDHMEEDVKQLLPHYNHSRTTANIKRVLMSIKSNQNVCSSALLWTEEQAQYIEYSLPFMFVLPPHFVIRRNDLALFEPFMDNKGHVSLERLLTESNLILGFTSARAYSKVLAPILDTHANSSNSFESLTGSITRPLLKMLTRNRFDYTIAYPSEVTYIARELDIQEDQFRTLPIAEGHQIQHAYFGCPKSPWGRQAVAAMNSVIKQMRGQPSFYGNYLKWLGAEGSREYQTLLEHGFTDTFPPTH